MAQDWKTSCCMERRGFEGAVEEAKQRWPQGVAIGKLGVALSDSRPPTLGG